MYISWFILGIILFLITLWVNAYTVYIKEIYKGKHNKYKRPLKLWVILFMFVIACIPVVNLSAFLAGLVLYIIDIIVRKDCDNDIKTIELGTNKFDKLLEFLNKSVC